jgi:hypothetical protein
MTAIPGSPESPLLAFWGGMTAIPAILAALCLRPSAIDPTPHRDLLKTKAKVPFNRPMTERSKPFFSDFQDSNRAQFQPCFTVSSVRSAEGYTV